MFVPDTRKKKEGQLSDAVNEGNWPGIDSTYRLIIVAALRSKQLLHGSVPRIAFDPRKRRNTSIALEEVKQGLVPFTIDDADQKIDVEEPTWPQQSNGQTVGGI